MTIWIVGTFLTSIVTFADVALDLGLSGNSIGYTLMASAVLAAVAIIIAPVRFGYRLLAILAFVILIPIQFFVTGILLVVFFGLDGVQ